MLPLVVAFLDQGKDEAYYAFLMLIQLCSQSVDVDHDHADLLARLQGVRRLSNIFCPEALASKDPVKQAAGKATSTCCRECCVVLHCIVFEKQWRCVTTAFTGVVPLHWGCSKMQASLFGRVHFMMQLELMLWHPGCTV